MGSVDKGRHEFTFKIEQMDNGSFVASVVHEAAVKQKDDLGALYYVVVVIFLYGCSILMMIASYIRKNNVDRKLNRYLKEMAVVRKRERQLQLFQAAAKAAAQLQERPSQYSDVSETDTDIEGDSHKGRRFSSSSSPRQFDKGDKVLLDLPSTGYNTDSDNETSTEGDTTFVTYARPKKSILKNSKSVKLLLPGEDEPSSPRNWKSSLESFQDSDDRWQQSTPVGICDVHDTSGQDAESDNPSSSPMPSPNQVLTDTQSTHSPNLLTINNTIAIATSSQLRTETRLTSGCGVVHPDTDSQRSLGRVKAKVIVTSTVYNDGLQVVSSV